MHTYNMRSSIKNIDEKPAVLLWSVSQLWQRQRKEALKPIHLTLAQYILLASLLWYQNQHKKVTQVTLAQRAAIDIMHASRILRTLEKRKLVTRIPSDRDSRANYVEITKQGKALTEKGSAVMNTKTNTFFASLKSKEKVFIELMKLLIEVNKKEVKI